MNSKIIRRSLIAFAAIGLLIQFIPVFEKTNPPVKAEPAWDDPSTRALAKRACFNCHSNETVWPWYASVAPVQWLVVSDVNEAREAYNVSDWTSGDVSVKKIEKEISGGDMPPIQYRLLHPEARLTEAEKQQLIKGLQETLK